MTVRVGGLSYEVGAPVCCYRWERRENTQVEERQAAGSMAGGGRGSRS